MKEVEIMPKILIIEDNQNIRKELSAYLVSHGFDCAAPEAVDVKIAFDASKGADLILLDINLGNISGFELCKNIRLQSSVPIIFVTGRDSEADEIRGICLGGDDFVKKPYSLPVLLARINRILERSRNIPQKRLPRGVILDIVAGQLKYGTSVLELSKNEMKILYFLSINTGCAVQKDALIEYLWENKLYVDENILNVNLSRLRKRLTGIGLSDYIKTVPQKGYLIGGEKNDPS